MGQPTEVSDDNARKVATAAKENDGLTIYNVMREVGSCGWSSLIKKANSADNEQTLILRAVESMPGSYAPISATISKDGLTIKDLATVSDTSCQRK